MKTLPRTALTLTVPCTETGSEATFQPMKNGSVAIGIRGQDGTAFGTVYADPRVLLRACGIALDEVIREEDA